VNPQKSKRSQSRNLPSKAGKTDLPAVLFDLDGTLIDTNYQHVTTWSEALLNAGIKIPRWKIHRRIGMSGKSFVKELLREVDCKEKEIDVENLEKEHDKKFRTTIPNIQSLPGTNDLLKHLARCGVRIAIATTGGRKATARLLRKLDIPAGMPILTGDDVKNAKPSPDVFVAAAQRLNVAIEDCIVVGDSVWDLLAAVRKNALGVGLLSGGSGPEELQRAGAFRVYSDPADLLLHIEQLGLPGQ
jgi:HAD superfamily hydrolase (TIGR01549 family)